MFELINSKLSIGARSAIIAACAAPPIALLLYLFVATVSQEIQAISRELVGADYVGEIWSALAPLEGSTALSSRSPPVRAEDPRNVSFGTVAEARAFEAAGSGGKLAAGVALIRAVGDGSGLTLDDDLASYYLMDAATVKLPRLRAAAVAASHAVGSQDRAFAMGEVANFSNASDYDLRQAIRHDDSGSARATIAAPAASLAAAIRNLRQVDAIGGAALVAQLAIDKAWRADRTELTRLLHVRKARLQAQLAVNLSLVTLSLGFAGILMIATARGMTGRLRGLLSAMDRLNLGDTSVEIPYLSDHNEIGRIAETLKAFRQGLINSVEERKQVEAANAALRRSEARYRLLANNVTDVILYYSLDGRIIYASPSVRQYGYTPEDLVGGLIGDMAHQADRAILTQLFADVKAGRPVRRVEWRTRGRDGRWHWQEGGPGPILDAAGALVGILLVMRNVDDRKTVEHTLREANAELIRVARVSALEALANSIAHEINQPLAAVVLNSDASIRWLTRDPIDLEKAVGAIRRTTRDARRASEIVGRMRSLVTKQESKHADFDANEAIGEVLMLIQHELQTLEVDVSLSLKDGSLLIYGDRVQFQQVMLNLILNAIDAMRDVATEERRLIIRTSRLENDDSQIEVEDRGRGIDLAVAERMFEHLFTTKIGGTGLGLSISKSIIEAHDGRIWAEPATPRGTRFRINIPSSGHRRDDYPDHHE
jgi:PAS domain S-box-containing protein